MLPACCPFGQLGEHGAGFLNVMAEALNSQIDVPFLQCRENLPMLVEGFVNKRRMGGQNLHEIGPVGEEPLHD